MTGISGAGDPRQVSKQRTQMRIALVLAVADDGTVTIDLGDGDPISEVPYLLKPTVGLPAHCLQQGGSVLVLGTTAGDPWSTIETDWLWAASTTTVAAGEVAANNASPAVTTQLIISEQDANGVNRSQGLSLIKTGAEVNLKTDARAVQFTATGSAVHQGQHYNIPVRHDLGATYFAPGERVTVEVVLG